MDEVRESLQNLLAGLGEATRFESVGLCPAVLPGLEVKGVGAIGVPVTAADAKRIIAKAKQAPYGRGEATIVDEEVRKVWQLEPSQFHLRNSAWSGSLATVVDAIKADFGIRGTVCAELYKLLVYEKGSFFKPHRDTEKIPGMFATLVVCLPSRHDGGTLVLEHDGQTKRIDFGGEDSEFQTRYAAFYADCRHEVTPVTSGYRLCLVYNLASADKKQPDAPQHADAVAKVAELLQRIFADGDSSDAMVKFAIPFRHQYTEAAFDPKQLKGVDRARADVLIRAAHSLDYLPFFALLTLHQQGIPDYSSFDNVSSWGRGRSRWSDPDDDDEEIDTGAGSEFEEIFDEDLKLEHWRDSEGREQSFSAIHFEDKEILGFDDKAAWSSRQEVHEATGNEGASMDRWYRQGVLAIWPRERHFHVLAAEGPELGLPALMRLIAESKSADDLAVCGQVAKSIIGNWTVNSRRSLGIRHLSGTMLKALERIGDAELAAAFVRDVFPQDFNGSEGRALLALCQRVGWKTLTPAIEEFLARLKPDVYKTKLNQAVAICERLCCDPPALSKERRRACQSLVGELMKLVERWDAVLPDDWEEDEFRVSWFAKRNLALKKDDAETTEHFSDEEREALALQKRGSKRIGVVASMVRLLSAVGGGDLLTSFVAHVLAQKGHYDLRQVLIPDVKTLIGEPVATVAGRRVAAQLLRHCLTELRAAVAEPPQPPADWRIEAELSCKCADCVAFNRFLRDPVERVGRFPMAKNRRQHLHRRIEESRCGVTHETERRGSPQTLVCTKTRGAYERRRKQFGTDQIVLAELEKLDERNKQR